MPLKGLPEYGVTLSGSPQNPVIENRSSRTVCSLGQAESLSAPVTLTHNALIRPMSAGYSAWLSLRASERILVKRLASRSSRRLEGPSGSERRNISIAC